MDIDNYLNEKSPRDRIYSSITEEQLKNRRNSDPKIRRNSKDSD
jgi:hypothetical protein